MKNNRPGARPFRRSHGPTPTPVRRTSSAGLTSARAAVLELLLQFDEPVGVADLVEHTSLHSNTLREHLQALVEAGLVYREPAAPAGRGRPAWLYGPVDDQAAHEYAGLAAALAASIQRNSRDPHQEAITAGTEWGRDLARRSAPNPGTPDSGTGNTGKTNTGTGSAGSPEVAHRPARDRVIALLDRIGFAPRPTETDGSLRLVHCPLLDAARQYPDVVCGVHVGIVRGALAECGDDTTRATLDPFAEPGACLLHLTAGAETPTGQGSDAS